MKKIKIAQVIEEGNFGGPQSRICQIAIRTKNDLNTTIIIPTLNSENFIKILKKNKLKFKTVKITKLSKNFKYIFKFIFTFPYELINLLILFRREKFDIIHIGGGAWQFKSLIAAKLSKSKVVWHINDTSMPKIIRFIFLIFYHIPDVIIYASNASKKYYEKLLINKKKLNLIVQAPVDTNFFKPKKKINTKLLKNKIIIGTVANISPVKSIETFIEIAELISQKYQNIEFLIIGKKLDTQKRYFNLIQKKICNKNIKKLKFIGYKENIKFFLNKMDIYVCTSKNESSPISVWEAMSMKLPVISTDVGDIAKMIRSNKFDFIIKSRKLDDFVRNLEKLILSQKLRSLYGSHLRNRAKKFLDINIISKKYLSIYSKLYSKP